MPNHVFNLKQQQQHTVTKRDQT